MGEAAALASAFLWAAASLVFARVGVRLPAVSLNLIKTGLAFVGLAATAYVVSGRLTPELATTSDYAWVGLSGLIGLSLGDSFYFGSLVRLGARRALVLWAFTPAATAWLASVVLKEPLDLRFTTGVIVTSLGVFLVLRERSGPGDAGSGRLIDSRTALWGMVLGGAAVACQAGGTVTAKLGSAGWTGLELSVVRLGVGTAGLLMPGVLPLRNRSLPRSDIGGVALGTFLGTYLGIWLSMIAIQHAPAGLVATLQSTSPVFVLPLARLFFNEKVGLPAWGGAALAVSGVAILML